MTSLCLTQHSVCVFSHTKLTSFQKGTHTCPSPSTLQHLSLPHKIGSQWCWMLGLFHWLSKPTFPKPYGGFWKFMEAFWLTQSLGDAAGTWWVGTRNTRGNAMPRTVLHSQRLSTTSRSSAGYSWVGIFSNYLSIDPN